MKERVLFITRPDQHGPAEDEAMKYAASNGCSMVVLFVLGSFLLHYGKNDWVVPGYARCQFLFHVLHDLARQACEREQVLKAKAAELGVDLRVAMIETGDFEPIMIKEASKDYRRIFVPKEKKKLFPLFGCPTTLQGMLERKGLGNIVSC